MIKVEDWIKALKHLALNRVTYYDNNFPSNCGEINPDGSISFDCIGLVKSLINELDIAYKTSPAGYFVTPGQVIPDASENGILYLCSSVSTSGFDKAAPGEYLCMYEKHAGVYVGPFQDPSGWCNVIECTVEAFDSGVTTSWVEPDGRRFDHKGGTQYGKWDAHGKLDKYIDYTGKPEKTTLKVTKITIKDGFLEFEVEN